MFILMTLVWFKASGFYYVISIGTTWTPLRYPVVAGPYGFGSVGLASYALQQVIAGVDLREGKFKASQPADSPVS